MPVPQTSPSSGRIAFTHPGFVRYISARFINVIALEMQSVAVGWQIYEITHRPLDLGFVGLAQFLPGVFLFLAAGHAADRFDRKKLLLMSYSGFALCSALLLAAAIHPHTPLALVYSALVLLGVVRTFNWTAARALVPQLVSPGNFPNAVAWSSSIFQAATILGPSLGGVLNAIFRGAAPVYAVALLASTAAVLQTAHIRVTEPTRARQDVNLSTVLAGFRYLWEKRIILGSISLDLFAVLLGGAVALLPVIAHEILHTGPWGLGLLRSAPGVGALLTAIAIAHFPVRRKAGLIMLLCVGSFGFFTILFGISHSVILSLVALFFVGASDMVSVIIRGVLIQIATPNEMRGRVNAVDMVFIGASNELGEFESGVTAQWLGAVPAVVLGGIGAIAVTLLWAGLFPDLRKANRLAVE